MAPNVQDNRERLIQFCLQHELIAINTTFKKQEKYKATYMKMGTTRDMEQTRETHEQIDWILTQKKWRNGYKNAESDPYRNINTDH